MTCLILAGVEKGHDHKRMSKPRRHIKIHIQYSAGDRRVVFGQESPIYRFRYPNKRLAKNGQIHNTFTHISCQGEADSASDAVNGFEVDHHSTVMVA